MNIFSKLFRSAPAQPAAPPSLPGIRPQSLRALQHDVPLFIRSLMGDGEAHSAMPQGLRDMNDKMIRMFEAGFTDAYSNDLQGTYVSANSDILTFDYRAIANARTLCGNRPQAKAALRTIMQNVVGDRGFRLDMRVGKWEGGKFVLEEDTNRILEAHYALAGLPKNFDAKQQWSRNNAFMVMAGSAWRDGRVLARRYYGYPHNDYGYAIKVLESDRLQVQFNGRSPVTGYPIRFSIERHPEFDFPVAYWLLSRHPGDCFGDYFNTGNETFRVRIPAEDIVCFNNLPERAEQEIGFTEMNSIVRTTHQNAQYVRALTLTSIATCFKPFWVKRTFPTGMTYSAEEFGAYANNLVQQVTGPLGPGGPVGLGANTVARQQGVTSPTDPGRPAETKVMNWGEELHQVSSEFPSEAGHEFRADNDHEAAVGAGVSYTEWTGRFDNMGFMAARLSRIPSQQNYRVRQSDMVDHVVRPEFREQIKSGIMMGTIPLPLKRLDEFVAAAHFRGQRWESANPLADIQAIILGLDRGIFTMQQVQNSLPDGVSVEDLFAALESEEDLMQLHNLNFTEEPVAGPTLPEQVPNEPAKPGDGPPDKSKPGMPQSRAGEGVARVVEKLKSRIRKHRGISPQTMALLEHEKDAKNGVAH